MNQVKWEPPPGTKVTMPSVLITDKNYQFTREADVQATWKRFGWVPPEPKPQRGNDE
jgi:hypothetical protein